MIGVSVRLLVLVLAVVVFVSACIAAWSLLPPEIATPVIALMIAVIIELFRRSLDTSFWSGVRQDLKEFGNVACVTIGVCIAAAAFGGGYWARGGTGPSCVPAPRVTGLQLDQAAARLATAHLYYGVSEVPGQVQIDEVVGQAPSAGDRPKRGDCKIALRVSTGVAVPKVVGLEEKAATSRVVEVGLRAKTRKRVSDKPCDEVIDQQPAAGTRASPNDLVRLGVSRGPPPKGMISTVGTPRRGPRNLKSPYPVTGTFSGCLAPGQHLWVAVEVLPGLLVVKKPEIVQPGPRWSIRVNDPGHGLDFALALFTVNSTGQREIRRWLVQAAKPGGAPALDSISGLRRLDTAPNLYLP